MELICKTGKKYKGQGFDWKETFKEAHSRHWDRQNSILVMNQLYSLLDVRIMIEISIQ